MTFVSNADYIKATVEIFGSILCIVMAVLLIMITKLNKKSAKAMVTIVFFCALGMLVDAIYYLHDPNKIISDYYMTRICNLLLFCSSTIQYQFALTFIKYSFIENGYEKKMKALVVPYALTGFVTMIPVSNIFYRWMYDFDEFNDCFRLPGWYVYTGLMVIAIIFTLIVVLANQKHLSRGTTITYVIFLLAPFIGIIIQAIIPGMAFFRLGCAISCFIMLLHYIWRWNKHEASARSNTNKVMLTLFTVMVMCVFAFAGTCVVSLQMMAQANSKEESYVVANMMSEKISNFFNEPIVVSETMALSDNIEVALTKDVSKANLTDLKIRPYLLEIQKNYGYKTVFVASEKSMAFFTHTGITKFLDVENDEHDKWYKDFVESGKSFELNVDTDETNNLELSFFVNKRVDDQAGHFLGVCGVGVSMKQLAECLKDCEKNYDIKINLVNHDGLIKYDSDPNRIERDSIYGIRYNFISSEDFYYENIGSSVRLIKYMDILDMYLVVEDINPMKINVFKAILPSFIILLVGIIMLLLIFGMFLWRDRHQEAVIKSQSIMVDTDKLTGLHNRNSYENMKKNKAREPLDSNLYVVVFDINGLKQMNDNYGHSAGDELILGAAACIKGTFGAYGSIYRTGGDEFCAFINATEDEAYETLDRLKEMTHEWISENVKEISLSVGIAGHKDYKEANIDELIRIADKLMYVDKRKYYEQTGRDRRK